MWIIPSKQWNEIAQKNKSLGIKKSLTAKSLRQISEKLNSRLNHSELWFDELLKKNSEENGPIVFLKKNYPIANRYFADYFIKERSIAIEIDESSHDEENDKIRDSHFHAHGIKVMRIKFKDDLAANDVIQFIKKNIGVRFELQKRNPLYDLSKVKRKPKMSKKERKKNEQIIKKMKWTRKITKSKKIQAQMNEMMIAALKK